MYICPNKNLPEWKALVAKTGSENKAWSYFINNNFEVPSLEQVDQIQTQSLPNINKVRNFLVSSDFFTRTELHPSGIKIKNKNLYPQAMNIVGRINTQYPGLLSIITVKNFNTQVNYIRINEGQQDLFKNYYDLPDVADHKSLLLKGFDSFQQQQEAIDVIASHVLAYLQDNQGARYKQGIEDFYTTLEEINTEEPKDIYKAIQTNKSELYKQVFNKLANQLELLSGPVLKGTSTESTPLTREEEEDQDVAPDTDESTKTWRDSWVFQYDAKSNALETVKKFLAFTPKSTYNKETGEYEIIESIIPGQPVYLPYDEVYEQLKAVLSGVENTWEAMEIELGKHQQAKPFIQNIIERINNYEQDKEQLKRQFVSTMSGVYSGFKTILVKDRITFDPTTGGDITIGKNFNIIDTDQASVEKVILNKWQGEFKRGNLYDLKDGNYVPNIKNVQDYIEAINKTKLKPTLENVKTLLNTIGINISESTLQELVEGQVGKLPINQQFESKSGLFTLIKNRLQGKIESDENNQVNETEENTLPNNPLVNNSAVKQLAKLEARNADYYFSNTFKDGEGNTVYSYTLNKFLTKEFLKLKNDQSFVESLLEVPFNKPLMLDGKPVFETWLYNLGQDKQAFKEVFNISPFDTVKVIGDNQDGTKLDSMSKLDLELTKIALTQNSGQRKRGLGTHTEGARVINYLLTIPSKTTSYVVKGTGHEVKVFFNKDQYTIDNGTWNALYSVVSAEYNRILTQAGTKNKQFYFFPTLNSIVIKDNKVLYPTDKIGDKTVETLIKEELKRIVIENIESKRAEWNELGIIKNNLLAEVDFDYKQAILAQQTSTEEQQVTYALADYIIQNILAKFNVTQTFIDDPAIYFKKDVASTWDNVGKRLTNLIAPFKDGLIDEKNKYYKSIKLSDRTSAALNRAQLYARLEALYTENNFPYNEINGTDAQEYVTLKEELNVAYSYGEISTDFYNKTLARIESEGDNLKLTKEESEIFFVPRKPVYSDRQVNSDKNTIERNYIKSASIVLAPELTKGLEIDKLRKAMEKLEEKNITVRAAFESATKLSATQAVNIWNEDGTIKDNLDLSSSVVILDRSNFGIQQEVPYDEKKDEILRSAQVLKLLFDGLDSIEGFRYNNKQVSGSELKETYTNLWKGLYEKALKSLEGELVESDKLIAKKFIKLLNEEGIKRGYNFAQLSFLNSNLDQTDFSIPFWAHINNDKEQSMITSLWTNRILKQKLSGGSYVLVSEEGFKGRGENILYTKEYDSSIGLKPMRIAYKKDSKAIEQEEFDKLSRVEQKEYREIVKPAQILTSWNLRGKNGKLLDRSKYTIKDEEGKEYLDLKLVPREILTQFGFRIPNQGHNSMALIEIVGFLPDTYASTVIASRNFITQMGSDFDVDKLYIYNYSLYDDTATGKLERDKNDERNSLLDIHKSVMYNPKVFNKIIKPLDEGRNKELTEEIKSLQPTKTENYLNPDFDRDKYIQSVDGKIMVGLTSTGNTFNTLLQNKGVYLQKKKVDKRYERDYITWKDKEGKILKLSDLSKIETIYGRTKNEIHQGIQSTAVDNEKDPKLDYLNAVAETYSVLNLLMKLGLEEADLYLFTAQPILKTYTERLKQIRSSLSTEYGSEESILTSLKDNNTLASIQKKTGDDNYADVALGENDLRKVLYEDQPINPYADKSQFTSKEIQQIVLAKFSKIKSYGDSLSRAQNIFNIESKGIGKSILDLEAKVIATDNVLKNPLFANLHSVAGNLYEDTLDPNTVTGHAITNSIYPASKVISNSNLMPFSNPLFRGIIQDYENITQTATNADSKYEIWKAIKAYNFSKLLPESDRTRIFFDNKGNKSLNTRITELSKTKLKHNPFILRLDLAKVDLSGHTPSLVLYNSAKEADIEETNIYQGFVDLVYNKEEDIRAIGRDLIYYYFLNGGSSNSKDYGRYIDANMLDSLEITNFLNQIDFNNPKTYGYTEGTNEVITQLFQHKPKLAPSILTVIDRNKVIITEKGIELPIKDINIIGQPSPVLRIGKTLYKHVENTNEAAIYSILSQKGGKFFNEYSANENNTILGKTKETPNTPATPENPISETKNTWVNPLIEQEYLDLTDRSLKDALSNVRTSKYYKSLADLFLKLESLIGNVQVKSATSDQLFAGRFTAKGNESSVHLNFKYLKDRGKIEKTLLKETIHVLFNKLYKNEFVPTQDQIVAREAIDNLFNGIKTQIINNDSVIWDKETFEKYNDILAKYRGTNSFNEANITQEDREFISKNKGLYYGLTNVEDFFHEALLQDEFMQALNKLSYDGDKSFLERIYEVIKDILNGFRDLVGINPNSALEEAFNNLLAITNSEISNNQTTSTDEDIFYDISPEMAEDQKKYEKIVQDYESRLKSISSSISAAELAGDKERKTELLNRIKEVREEQQTLIAENSLDTIIAVAHKDLEEVSRLLKKEDLNETDIRYINLVLGTWTKVNNTDVYSVLTSKDIIEESEDAQKIEEIVAQANRLKRRSDEAQKLMIHKQAEEVLKRPVDIKEVTQVKDISSGQAVFRDITSSDNVVLHVVDKWIRKADFATVTELTDVIEELDTLTKNLHDKGIKDRKDFVKIFGQTITVKHLDKSQTEELTGEIVDALTAEYFKTRDNLKQAIEDAPDPKFRQQAAEKYYDWIKDNHIIVDYSSMYEKQANGTLKERENNTYLKALEKQAGDSYELLVKNARDRVNEYNEELELQIKVLHGNSEETKKLEIWQLENSPLIYLDNLKNGLTIRKVDGETIFNEGWKYISKRAKKEWEDSKYNEIHKEGNEHLAEYYAFYRETMKRLRLYLPYHVRQELKATDIPSVEKTLINELYDSGIAKYANRTWSALLDEISVSKKDLQRVTDPITGDFTKEFTFDYLNKINPEDKSYDLTRVLKLFAAQAIGYKYKAQIEDKVRLAESVLKSALEKQMRADGTPDTDRFGKTTTTKGLTNLYNQLDYVIDAFYGHKKDIKEGKTSKEFITPRDKEKIQEELEKGKKAGLDDDQLGALELSLKEKYSKAFSFSRLGDTLLQYVQLKGMGWNVFAGVNNMVFGQIANYNWSVSNKDFSDSDISKAVYLMLQDIKSSEEKPSKIRILMTKFNTVKQLRDKIYSATTNYNKAAKGLEKFSPYVLYAKGEYFVQGQVMVAMLNHQQVDVIEHGVAKKIPLFEAFNEQGEWNTARFGENKAWGKNGDSTLDFKLKLDTILKKIHGNYDPNSAMLINKRFLGRAMIQFRRWIPEGIAQRFDSEKYDNYLGRKTKGRYRTFYDLGLKKSLTTLFKAAIYRGSDKAFEGLGLEGEQLELAKENILKNLREIYFKLSMMGMYLFLASLDDDDEWSRAGKNYTLNTILRLQDDIEFYVSPIAADNIIRTPLPVFNLISDFYKVGDAVVESIEGNGFYKNGIHSGDSKLFWKTIRLLPGGSSGAALASKFGTVETFRK